MKIGAFLLLFAFAEFASAQTPKCEAPTNNSLLLAEATDLVRALPETVAWSKSHNYPVAYLGVHQPLVRSGKCFIAIDVYADRRERLDPWHFFYVNVESKAILVVEPVNGEAISLKEWRSNALPQ
ncbi:MAG: hypothetical protein EON58_12965 [Alphaproteobacteria bacterium]|nr:MAG: hypothetical protein EON58_12965 [Alphaproteobacteria bacterium]